MKIRQRFLTATAIVTLTSSIATAGTQSLPFTIPTTSGAFTDISLLSPTSIRMQGTLTSITITLNRTRLQPRLKYKTTRVSVQSFTGATSSIPLTLAGPGGVTTSVNAVAGPFSGIAVPNAVTVVPNAPAPANGTLTINVPAASFSAFEVPPSSGTGTYTFSATSGMFTGTAQSGVFFGGTESAGGSGTVTFTFTTPRIVACPAVNSGEVGVPFSSPAIAVDGGTPPYTFSVVGTLPAGLTLNSLTGAITGTPTASGSFAIQVTDANGTPTPTSCPFTITPGPSITTCPTGSSGEIGVPFNSPAISVTGGALPYTFSVVGTLPNGLVLNTSTGAVTGTPTATGSFAIQVKDADGSVAPTTCPFTIVAGPSIIACPTVNSGEAGVPFNSGPISVTGGAKPYTFSVVGTLPNGLLLNTSTGAITGTPTATGSFAIQVKDADGIVASTTCPFTVVTGPAIVACPVVNSGEVAVPFNSPAIAVTGGALPYTFSVVGTLPNGLMLNTSTGAITGTPTAPGPFAIQVKDADGIPATTTCPFTIITGPRIVACPAVSSTVNSGEMGVPFNSPAIAVTGGALPYTFSVVGTLPNGLTLNVSTGAITGTPTTAGSFNIQVKDADGQVAPTTCPFTIVTGPSIVACPAVNSGQVGVPFNSPAISVTGGALPYIFSVVGMLPGGLTLNMSTGAITGTPTAPGSFAIQVKDADGQVAPTTCPFTITSPVQMPTCPSNPVNIGEIFLPFNSPPISVSGGTPPYTFSVVMGTLPPGLTLNTSTGAITGTPTAIGTFSIQVTDATGLVIVTCPFSINMTDVTGATFLVKYAANLNIGESYIDITNPGTNGAPLQGPGLGATSGNLCVNVYAFDASEELVACCSCLVTPDQTVNLGVNRDLTTMTLTGVVPTSVTIKLLATLAGGNGQWHQLHQLGGGGDDRRARINGLDAWGTTLHATPGGSYATTEARFTASSLSQGELNSIGGRCASVVGNGSGFGVCASCRSGALGGSKIPQ